MFFWRQRCSHCGESPISWGIARSGIILRMSCVNGGGAPVGNRKNFAGASAEQLLERMIELSLYAEEKLKSG